MCGRSKDALLLSLYSIMLACQNPMPVSGKNWHDCINLSQDLSMIGMNVKQMYNKWNDTVSDEEIDITFCFKRNVWSKEEMGHMWYFNIGDADIIINEFSVN